MQLESYYRGSIRTLNAEGSYRIRRSAILFVLFAIAATLACSRNTHSASGSAPTGTSTTSRTSSIASSPQRERILHALANWNWAIYENERVDTAPFSVTRVGCLTEVALPESSGAGLGMIAGDMKLLISTDDTLGAIAVQGPVDVSGPTSDAPKGSGRKARILAHLKAASKPMQSTKVTMSDFHPVKCMEEFTLSVSMPSGEPVQVFLWTSPDDKTLYWLGAKPFAITKSVSEIEAERTQKAHSELASLKALMQKLPCRGQPDAKVHVVVFIDPADPDSGHAVRLLETVMASESQTVRAAAVYLPPKPPSNPPSSAPPVVVVANGWSKTAAFGTLCAARQTPDHYWEMLREYLEHQVDITDSSALGQSTEYARKLRGIDLAAWTACVTDFASPAHQAINQLIEDGAAFAAAQGADVPGTFIVNSKVISPEQLTAQGLMTEIREQLKRN
jgi:hypothetical protein